MSKHAEKNGSAQIEAVEPAALHPEVGSEAKETDTQVQFLLAEYDRLKGLEISQSEVYYSRFNSFMTVSLAIIGAYVTLVTADSLSVSISFPVLPDLLALVILVWGIFTFLGLTEITCATRHVINALRDIRAYFTERHAVVADHLYYQKPELYEVGNWVERLAGRYLFRGSPKAILTLINSSLSAILVAR